MTFLPPTRVLKQFVSILLLCTSIAGCARKTNPDINRGTAYKYIQGYPEVQFSAVGFLDQQGAPTITLTANVVYSSLIYKEVDSEQKASISIEVRILKDSEDSESSNTVSTKQYNYTFSQDSDALTASQNFFDFEKQMQVTPGSFTVNMVVTDLHSGKSITRTTNTAIPDPTNNQLDLTEVRMFGKNMDAESPDWTAINTYDVPMKVDSVMFVFQVTNNSSDSPLTIQTELVRFESDTSIARPMHLNNYSPSSIEYKGIDQTKETILNSNTRQLSQTGSVLIEFRFKRQERGNYRFRVQSDKEDADLFKARDYGVKSENYPAIKTAKEIARPLAYLMNDNEHEALMRISDPDSLKKEIDRFWLKNIGNTYEATTVLRLYYERVEEANKQFANFKEGWKTDQGMIYILFGPPWYINHNFDQMVWSYSYNNSDPNRNFLYIKPTIRSEYFPFQHFLLQRNQQYFNTEYQQRELWLSGLILKRRL